MVRRRRNKVVIWDWSPDGSRKGAERNSSRRRSVGRDALGAVLLLGVIVFLLARIPDTDGSYRRDRLGHYMCELVRVDSGTPQCSAVAIIGWFAIVVMVGVILKIGRIGLKFLGIGRGE